jgi:hypothetical protein
MHRVIARTLLFALLAGLFSPLAAASSMSASHPHCMRKPTPAPVAEMSGCHHHGTSAPQVTEPGSSDQIKAPNDCCQDHECCRSMARPQWAHASLPSTLSEPNQVTQLSAVPDTQARSFEAVHNPPGRAPPLL